jgi:vanillate/4-hydroxybenzoate decarboxylase subunit D
MKCVRCIDGDAEVVAKAPDSSGAWEIYRCTRCNYGWRSTEPDNITDPAERDPFFRLDKKDLSELPSPLPLP